jgi:hypothetical protein
MFLALGAATYVEKYIHGVLSKNDDVLKLL